MMRATVAEDAARSAATPLPGRDKLIIGLIAFFINSAPFMDAVPSINWGSAASRPSGVIDTRSLIATLSEAAISFGSVEHVLRWRLNSAIGLDPTAACSMAGASCSSVYR